MNEHITDILDNQPFGALTNDDRARIQVHVESCGDCGRAFAAARVSALLLQERAAEAEAAALSANPFFQTRVMAAWRERGNTGVSALRRLWNATGALVASMAVTTAALAALTFVLPATDSGQQTVALAPYSAEAVVLEQNNDQLTDDQVLNAIYSDDDDDGGK